MKGAQYLSQFQKEQYANYLESQLEKFSAFMLAQRRENERWKQLEDRLAHHDTSLLQLKGQLQLVEVYQHQNLQNCEHVGKRMAKLEGLEQQVQRLDDRCRLAFGQ
jgi:DNA repair ATPase RecN